MKWLALVVSFCALSAPLAICGAEQAYSVRAWEVPIESAVNDYFTGTESTQLNVSRLKEYDNRIYNHILSINPEISNRICILRSNKKPIRDLLFIDGKLYEIMERHDSVDEFTFKTVFVNMKNAYGLPEMKKEKEITIYTFKNDKTNAILMVRPFGNSNDIRIYLYSQSLFRILFRE
jgi:hypothetical protein